MKLSLVLHGHQPPGNYHEVFERAQLSCYGPVLDLLEERPAIRLSMHWSGPLLEWLMEHAPERIAQLRRLVERDQVELVTAGLYEPVLVLLPPVDRLGQLLAHRAYLEELFGRASEVGWLTERVWEPELAADLVEGGIDIVTLDDQHLAVSGVDPQRLDAPYLTEAQGRMLRVAPASGPLRMAVPWHPVDEVMALIREHAERGDRMLVYADDIEKFGLWPGTFADVIESGWLARFFDEITALSDVEVVPVGEAVRETPDAGRAYIADGSYPEMLEWSLPVEAHRRFVAARSSIPEGDPAGVLPFLRAGQYRQFLAKYPEVNHLHKRMLEVSARIHAAIGSRRRPPANLVEARRHLWRAQANCVYWHGLFGGSYLPVLRHTAWHELLTAERLVQEHAGPRDPVEVRDVDADGHEEVVLANEDLIAVVAPSEGAVIELSHLPSAMNLANTLARRPEAYHDPDDRRAVYDPARRGWFVDHVARASSRAPRAERTLDQGGFAGGEYSVRARARDVTLARESRVGTTTVRVEKRIRLAGRTGIEARYHVDRVHQPRQGVGLRFGVSIDLGLLYHLEPAGAVLMDDEDHRAMAGGAGTDIRRVVVQLDGVPVRVTFEMDPPAQDVGVEPVVTHSRSESGTERTPQSLTVMLSWLLAPDAEEPLTPRIRVSIGAPRAGRGAA